MNAAASVEGDEKVPIAGGTGYAIRSGGDGTHDHEFRTRSRGGSNDFAGEVFHRHRAAGGFSRT